MSEESLLLKDVEDVVIVNIWLSKKNQVMGGHGTGHASLSAGGNYYSFWPKDEDEFTNSLKKKEGEIIDTYEKDCSRESTSTAATHKIALYSLNVDKVMVEAERLLKAEFQLKGQVMPALKTEKPKPQNCSSYVLSLLNAGGLYSLTKTTGSSRMSSRIKTPENLLVEVAKAKLNEVKKHGDACHHEIEGETSLSVLEDLIGENNLKNWTLWDKLKILFRQNKASGDGYDEEIDLDLKHGC